MSIVSWKKEFYRTPAGEAAKGGDAPAILHSLEKWRGLRPVALAAHSLRLRGCELVAEGDKDRFCVDESSCALCRAHTDEFNNVYCPSCPVYAANGGVGCDDLCPGQKISAYHSLTKKGDPEPMISLLELAAQKHST